VGNASKILTYICGYLLPGLFLDLGYINRILLDDWHTIITHVNAHYVKKALSILYYWWGHDKSSVYLPRLPKLNYTSFKYYLFQNMIPGLDS